MTGSAVLITAIEAVWAEICKKHPDTPQVIVTLAAGSRPNSADLKAGHFAAERWVRPEDGEDVHELFVGGEALEYGPVSLLGTLLHEAAHGIAHNRGVKDTSRQNRYHNRRFRALAQEVGIHVEHTDNLGYSATTVPEVTAEYYAGHVRKLDAAITAYRRSEPSSTGRRSSNNGQVLTCSCNRKVRASTPVADAGPIICGLCKSVFATPSHKD